MHIHLLHISILFEHFQNVNMANLNHTMCINCIASHHIHSTADRIFSGHLLKSCFGWIVSILGYANLRIIGTRPIIFIFFKIQNWFFFLITHSSPMHLDIFLHHQERWKGLWIISLQVLLCNADTMGIKTVLKLR